MIRRLPPLKALRAFEVVSRHSSFRDAAKELHVTAAAVGQQVKALEAHVGRKLVRRHSSGYVLTPEALAAVPDLEVAFQRMSAAVNRMSEGARRVLTVSVGPSLATMWLVPRLQKFEHHNPNIDLLIHSSEQVADLESSLVDVALRYGSGAYAGAESTQFFDGDLFPVCSPQFLSGDAAIRAPVDLRGRPLLHSDWLPPKGAWPDWSSWLQVAGVDGVDHRRGLRFSDQAMAVQAAVAGRGVALSSLPLARDHLEAKRLVRPFKTSVPTDFAYFVVISKRRASDPDILRFKRWVLAEARK